MSKNHGFTRIRRSVGVAFIGVTLVAASVAAAQSPGSASGAGSSTKERTEGGSSSSATGGSRAAGDADAGGREGGGATGEARGSGGSSSTSDASERRRDGRSSRDVTRRTQRVSVVDGVRREVELVMENGEMRATIDGRPARVVQHGAAVEILTEDGVVVDRVLRPDGDPAVFGRGAELLDRVRIGPGGRLDGRVGDGPAPRAVLGVHLAEPDEALRTHLGLQPGSGVIVTHVLDGSAAALAGVAIHDIVVGIDGVRPVSMASLRRAIAENEPGRTVRLELIRRGAPRELAVRLAGPVVEGGRTDEIDRILRDRLGPDVNVEILRDVDDLLRRHIFVVPEPPAPPVTPDAPTGLPRMEMPREMIFQSLPLEGMRGGVSLGGFGEERLRALEMSVARLSEQIERLVQRLEAAD